MGDDPGGGSFLNSFFENIQTKIHKRAAHSDHWKSNKIQSQATHHHSSEPKYECETCERDEWDIHQNCNRIDRPKLISHKHGCDEPDERRNIKRLNQLKNEDF